jgi:hypothetical protein
VKQNRAAVTPPASMRSPNTHRVTHVTGRRVTCSCGWATAANVRSQAAGQQIAEAHLQGVNG